MRRNPFGLVASFLSIAALVCASPANAASITLLGQVISVGGQTIDQAPVQIVNPNNGTPCFVGNSGCPSIGGSGGGAVTAALGAYVDGSIVTIGALADAACPTDNGVTCTTQALIKRTNQRITSLIAAIGTPMQQTGGSVAIVGPFGSLLQANALGVALDTVDAAALQSIISNIASAIPAGSNLIGHVDGAGAQAASVTGNPARNGCRTATAAPTATTDGQLQDMECGAEGKQIVLPYTIKELAVRGSTGAITNTTQTSIIASAGGSLKNYITAIQCANSGATTSILTFTDAATTILINPAGGGGSWTFPVPLATAAATAFQVTPGSSSTSQYCSAQGYTGL